MLVLLAALAVFKIIHVIDALLPKEPANWVKVVATVVVSVPLSFGMDLDKPIVSGLAIATLAGAVHALLRLITLAGDRCQWTTRR